MLRSEKRSGTTSTTTLIRAAKHDAPTGPALDGRTE
jgi:hypothetical protein